MPGMRWLASLVWFATVAAPSPAAAPTPPAEDPAVHIGIVLDRAASAVNRHVAAMIAEADAIWRPHGVRVSHPPRGAWAPDLIRLTLRVDEGGAAAGASVRGRRSDGEGLGTIWFAEDG